MESPAEELPNDNENSPKDKTSDEICAEFLREQLREYIFYKDVRHRFPEYVQEYVSRHTNNHHIVPLGVLSVLFCLYFGTLIICEQCTLDSKISENLSLPENLSETFTNNSLDGKDLLKSEEEERAFLLEKFLEHKDFCYNLQVFTEDLSDLKPTFIEPEQIKFSEEMDMQSYLLDSEFNAIQSLPPSPVSSFQNEKSRRGRKSFGKNRKAEKKYKTGQSKDSNKTKSSTAEPFIYCLAVVFVYLLAKALSDINQHYKGKKKNEKGARRCSLQSYAQSHKQDRRASKGTSVKTFPKTLNK